MGIGLEKEIIDLDTNLTTEFNLRDTHKCTNKKKKPFRLRACPFFRNFLPCGILVSLCSVIFEKRKKKTRKRRLPGGLQRKFAKDTLVRCIHWNNASCYGEIDRNCVCTSCMFYCGKKNKKILIKLIVKRAEFVWGDIWKQRDGVDPG